MANPVCEVLLTESPLDSAQNSDANVGYLECGAVVVFQGVVRQSEQGREIDGIEYEAHRDMATHQLKLIAEEAAQKFELGSVAIHHRIGFVAVGETSLWLCVRTGHRRPAFEAASWIVEQLKQRVPIWKQPRFSATKRVACPPAAVMTG